MNAQAPLPPVPGDEIAALLERARPRLRGLLARFRIPLSEGDDLVQEACLSVLRHWGRIENPEAWLLHVFYWVCCGHIRRQRKARLRYLDAELLEDLAREQRPAQEQAERLWDLDRLASRLPERYRQILLLRYGLGLSSEEVAAHLGYRHSSIGSLIQRSLARLRASAAAPATRFPAPRHRGSPQGRR